MSIRQDEDRQCARLAIFYGCHPISPSPKATSVEDEDRQTDLAIFTILGDVLIFICVRDTNSWPSAIRCQIECLFAANRYARPGLSTLNP